MLFFARAANFAPLRCVFASSGFARFSVLLSSLTAGGPVAVLSDPGDGWVDVLTAAGTRGLVPSNYILAIQPTANPAPNTGGACAPAGASASVGGEEEVPEWERQGAEEVAASAHGPEAPAGEQAGAAAAGDVEAESAKA